MAGLKKTLLEDAVCHRKCSYLRWPQEALVLCLTPEEKDAIACFVELTFPSYHCKTPTLFKMFYFINLFSRDNGRKWFWFLWCSCGIRTKYSRARFFPPHCLVASLPFLSSSCNFRFLCVLLFQSHLLSLLYTPPYLSPFIFSLSSVWPSLLCVLTLPPLSFLILGWLSYFAPISHPHSLPHHSCSTPLFLSLHPSLFS